MQIATFTHTSVASLVASKSWLKPLLKTINNTRCRAWDFIHGVETCGDIPLATLNFQSKNKTSGLEYQSHHPAVIRAGLLMLAIRPEEFIFIDFGCGKGRALLVASELPFRKIIGLEFAPVLAESARRNVENYRSRRQKCSQIEILTVDATEYALTPEPQILYFYSPFSRSVMDQVLDNIETSLRQSPRDLLVMFSGAIGVRDRVFASCTQYKLLQRGRYIDIYRHRSCGI